MTGFRSFPKKLSNAERFVCLAISQELKKFIQPGISAAGIQLDAPVDSESDSVIQQGISWLQAACARPLKV